MTKAKLHLIPNILAENASHSIPNYIKDVVSALDVFYVEEIRSARRFLKMMNKEIVIDNLQFHLLNEHHRESLSLAKGILQQGISIGFLSEAGCPNIADPGQELAAIAHSIGIQVIPHIGPNSILLALMASGFNGQQFQFLGYLPNKQPFLSQKIKEIEQESKVKNCSQIFIETPYRNDQLIAELIKNTHPNTRLCVASNLTGEEELIVSRTIKEWKENPISFHKKPAVFVLFAGQL